MYEAGSTHPLPAAAGRGALREPTDFHRAVRIVAGNLFEDVEECERERLACMGRVCGVLRGNPELLQGPSKDEAKK
jgi:hypothetical protein